MFSCRSGLQHADLRDIEHVVQEFVHMWQNNASSLELTAPLKLHVLATHIVEFTKTHRATPAAYGEQDGECAHRVFSQLKDTFRSMGPRALCHTVKVFNACRF